MRAAPIFLVSLSLVLGACAMDRDRDRDARASYERSEVGQVREVESGEIVSLTPVDIERVGDRAGTIVGALAGGLAGRQLGGGSGRDIATVVGAVAGGYAGREFQDEVTPAEGVEIGLRLDDGREIAIIQELEEDDIFRVGDRVDVEITGDRARVAPRGERLGSR